MALTQPHFTSEMATKAMLDGLTDRIRSDLKARILEKIEPDINAAVEASIESLKLAIESHRDYTHMQDVIKFIVEKR